MNPIFAAALEFQTLCKARQWRYCVIGGMGGNGVPVDVALGAMPFEERATERASEFAIGGDETLLTCSAEDLVVFTSGRASWVSERRAAAAAA